MHNLPKVPWDSLPTPHGQVGGPQGNLLTSLTPPLPRRFPPLSQMSLAT